VSPARLRAVISANIRRLAARKKLTLPLLADLAAVPKGVLYRVVKREVAVRVDTLAKLAAALDVLPRQLVDERSVSDAASGRRK
jgi:transcriptional regulator with XRE-family HTH domain